MKPVRIIFILLTLTFGLLGVPYADSIAGEADETGHIDQDEGQAGWLTLWTRVQKIRLDRMKAYLQLDEATMLRLTPHLNRLDKRKKEIGKERLFLMKRLKKSTAMGATPKTGAGQERGVEATLRRLEENQAALEALKQEQKGLLKAHLTLDQQARYILFQREFKEELRDIIRKERGNDEQIGHK